MGKKPNAEAAARTLAEVVAQQAIFTEHARPKEYESAIGDKEALMMYRAGWKLASRYSEAAEKALRELVGEEEATRLSTEALDRV